MATLFISTYTPCRIEPGAVSWLGPPPRLWNLAHATAIGGARAARIRPSLRVTTDPRSSVSLALRRRLEHSELYQCPRKPNSHHFFVAFAKLSDVQVSPP